MNFYELLGISKEATKDEIKKKYREMAKKYHPDRYVNSTKEEKEKAENMFKDINNAYEVLIDDDRKAEYDRKNGGGDYSDSKKKSKSSYTSQESYEDIYNRFSKASMDDMFNDFMKKGTKSKEEKVDDKMKEGVNNMFESFFSFDKKGKGKK